MLISKIRNKTQYVIWTFVIIFGASIFFLWGMDVAGGGGRQQRTSKVPDTILKVNGKTFDQSSFYYKYLRLQRQYELYAGQRFDTYPEKMYLRSSVIDQIVSQEILLDEAKKRKISANSAEVSQRIDQEMSSYVGAKRGQTVSGVKGKMDAHLKAKERDKAFRNILARQGVTTSQFEEFVKQDVLQEKVIEDLGSELLEKEKADAVEKAMSIREKLNSGETFEKLATEFSEDEGSKSEGGDLGWMPRGILPENFEQAAFALQPGQVSAPVETDLGIHLIKLVDKKVVGDEGYEQAMPDIVARLSEDLGIPAAEVTPDQIKKEYEKVYTRHILVRIPSKQQVVSDWVQKKRQEGGVKIDIVNPELKAFRYLNRQLFEQGAAQPDYDEALSLYQKATDVDPGNPYLYNQIGSIYERMNSRVLMDKLMKESETPEDDPYAQAMQEKGIEETAATATEEVEKVTTATSEAEVEASANETETTTGDVTAPVEIDENQYLPEAYGAYTQAVKIGEEEYKYDVTFFMNAGRLADKLDKKEEAVKYYAEGLDFAVDSKQYLEEIRDTLSTYEGIEKAAETVAEAEGLLAELEEAEKEAEAPSVILDDEETIPQSATGTAEVDGVPGTATGTVAPDVEERPES